MSEEKNGIKLILLSLCPILLLLFIDYFSLSLQQSDPFIPHLALSLFTAQLLALLIFIKGEICPGQRGRLIQVHLAFAIYWLVWIGISFGFRLHSAFIHIISLCGLVSLYLIYKQLQDNAARQSFLAMAGFILGLGVISYFIPWAKMPVEQMLQYNPISQILVGVILLNLALVISRNRLQGFIRLLPLLMILILAFNALIVLGFLIYISLEHTLNHQAFLAYCIYLALHLTMAFVLCWYVLKQWKLDYQILLILLFMAASFPVWEIFATMPLM